MQHRFKRYLPQSWLRSESSLAQDFALVSGIILFVVFFLATWIAWDARQNLAHQEISQLETNAKHINQQLDGLVDSTGYILQSLARQVELFGETDHTQIARLLTSFDTRPDVYGLFAWINKSQMIKISSNMGVIEIPTVDVSDEEYQREAMTSPWKPHVGHPIGSRHDHRDLPLVIGLTDDTGLYIGTLIMSLDIDRLVQNISNSQDLSHYSFAVYSAINNELLGETSANEQLGIKSVSQLLTANTDIDIGKAAETGVSLHRDKDSGMKMLVYHRKDAPYIVAIAEKDSINIAGIIRAIAPRLLQIAIPAGFLLGVLWLIRKRLIRPVIALSEAASSLARGNQQIDIPIDGPVEITHLALQLQRIKEYILERKMIEEELRRKTIALKHAKEESELADRTKSEFLACMSHELRTPLNAIIGFSDVILKQYYGDLKNAKYEQYVTDIRNSGQHLLEIINDILDLAKVEAGAMALSQSETELKPLVEKTMRLLSERAMHADLKIDTVYPDSPLPKLLVDPLRIKQILINLLSNAIKFTPKGGHIEVKVEYRPHHPFPIAIHIKDTGIGMAPEEIPIALSKFGQVERGGGGQGSTMPLPGTGLGLPLSRELIHLHQGELTIQSEPNKGTTVTVTLPAARIISG
ncbi:HAMP domain-containing protein [bacterium]|nr:HAMP domain-containing protein [bacterium]